MYEITSQGKKYKITRRLSLPEVTRARQILGKLLEEYRKRNDKPIDENKVAEIDTAAIEILALTSEQDQFIVDTFENLGITQEIINTLEYPDGVKLFNDIFEFSVTIPKNLDVQSDTVISSPAT